MKYHEGQAGRAKRGGCMIRAFLKGIQMELIKLLWGFMGKGRKEKY